MPDRGAGGPSICGSILCWSELPGVLSTWRSDRRGEDWPHCTKDQLNEPGTQSFPFPAEGLGRKDWNTGKTGMSPFSFRSVSLAVMTTERGLTGVDQSFSGSEMSHLANSFMWKLQNLSGHLWKPQSSETTARFLFVLGVLFCFVLFCC